MAQEGIDSLLINPSLELELNFSIIRVTLEDGCELNMRGQDGSGQELNMGWSVALENVMVTCPHGQELSWSQAVNTTPSGGFTNTGHPKKTNPRTRKLQLG